MNFRLLLSENPTGSTVRLEQPDGDNPAGLYFAESRSEIPDTRTQSPSYALTTFNSDFRIRDNANTWHTAQFTTPVPEGGSWAAATDLWLPYEGAQPTSDIQADQFYLY